jgi:hypothetical protein
MEPSQITNYLDLILRLGLDITAAWLVTMGLFYPHSKKKSLVFCLFMFNLLIFIVGYILSNTNMGLGTGLGLFAIFTMLRYRSETLNLREMTYIFIIITIGFINATNGIHHLGIILFLDILILALAYYLEKFIGNNILSSEKVKYDNLELLKPQYRHLLNQDIFLKTGIKPKTIAIECISLTDKTANLTIYYDEKEFNNTVTSIDSNRMISDNNEAQALNKEGRHKNENVVLRVLQ